MGRFFIRLVSTSLAVLFAAWILGGVRVDSTLVAMTVALLLGLLNTFVKPILVFLTIPITVVTLGIFLLVINIFIIKFIDSLVTGFSVETWFTALIFSFIVSFTASLIEGLIGVPKKEEE
jgi:putative membrane protein